VVFTYIHGGLLDGSVEFAGGDKMMGNVRTLGEPWVSAYPNEVSPSEVDLVVAWELSWYQYRVDLGDAEQPVTLFEKGHELDELDGGLRDWNGSAGSDGSLAAAVGSRP
jgi:hypothetical protein